MKIIVRVILLAVAFGAGMLTMHFKTPVRNMYLIPSALVVSRITPPYPCEYVSFSFHDHWISLLCGRMNGKAPDINANGALVLDTRSEEEWNDVFDVSLTWQERQDGN